jgi:serine/threonine protein phosphatase PrpC
MRPDGVPTPARGNQKKGNRHLLVVAYGMGGHSGGCFASKSVIAVAKSVWEQEGEVVKNATKFLQRICELAHESINDYGKKYNRFPHSTCVLLYIDGKQAWWAHLGDSRLYHFRGGKLLRRKEKSNCQHDVIST